MVGDTTDVADTKPSIGNDDYKADLDAVNIVSSMKKNNSNFITTSNSYYDKLENNVYNRAEEFKKNVDFNEVKDKIYNQLSESYILEKEGRIVGLPSNINYIKEKYNLLIGERAGEDIKISVGSAIQLPEELSIVVKGRDQISGLLSRVELTSEDVREAMREPLKEIADALKTVLEMMPPDLAGDIVENGIVLTGGGALIRGLDKYLSDIVKLPVFVADDPLLAVARGTGKALEEIKFLQQLVNEE